MANGRNGNTVTFVRAMRLLATLGGNKKGGEANEEETTVANQPKSLLFKFEMLPPNAGDYARMHWAVRKQVRDGWEYHVAQMVRDMGYFPNEDNVLVHKATIVWRLFVKRRRDKDNAHQMLKIPMDAMRRQFIIFNDSPKWIDIRLEQTNSQKEWCEIEIIPEEGEENAKRPKQKSRQQAPSQPADNPVLPVWT